ncbi:unnamed protein product [Paramecium primaurelia]|uniref:PA domain-containing protein n=1 Tax=Paramecium primaurelia TaxID=5886 RepID=A0A8S1PB48_PARPR|nr:unnamed protein product [Paramecium primaurelia]
MLILSLLLIVKADQYFTILSPNNLATDEKLKEIQFKIANFGYVPYGQKISGELEIAIPYNFCEYQNITKNFNNDISNSKILLVQKGYCSNYQKAINAQIFGYVMMVIVDDNSQEFISEVTNNTQGNLDIQIPTIMIQKTQGDKLKDYLEQINHKTLYIQVLFPDFFQTDKVKYEYWFSSMDQKSYKFLRQFYTFHMQMKDSLEFTPHYTLGRCAQCAKSGFDKRDSLCLSGGRYCAADPDGDGPLDGQDAVREVVRQICIFKEDKIKWWNYVIKYSQQCLGSSISIANLCYQYVLELVNIDQKKIEKCYNDSFSNQNDELHENILLAQEYKKHEELQIRVWPLLYINDIKYKGSLTVSGYKSNFDKGDQEIYDTSHFGPFQAICKSFTINSLPDVCQNRMVGYSDQDGDWYEYKQETNTWIVWLIVLTIMGILMICTLYLYKRLFIKKANEEINQQVNINLAQYYAMNEQDRNLRN